MATFIDAHCHVDVFLFLGKKVENAREKNVNIMISNGINKETNRKTLELSEKYSEIKAALGLYPIEALKLDDNEIDEEINFIIENREKIIAIGEVGMDFAHDNKNIERQKNILDKFIDLAKKIDKPIIVHSRKAEKECIEMLEKKQAKKVVMHYFSGKFKLVERIVKNDWLITIPSSVVYSEHFQNIVKKVPLSSLLCETDSPHSHPLRKEKNEPKFVVEGYKKIAEIKGMDILEVRNNMFMNYQKLI